jgi:hypothetical protein
LIELYDVDDRRKMWIRYDQIAEVVDRPDHYGGKSQVRTVDGRLLHVAEDPDIILKKIKEEEYASKNHIDT